MKKTFVHGQIGLHRIPREEEDHPSEHHPASPGHVGYASLHHYIESSGKLQPNDLERSFSQLAFWPN